MERGKRGQRAMRKEDTQHSLVVDVDHHRDVVLEFLLVPDAHYWEVNEWIMAEKWDHRQE